jgi:hypothetical protein
MKISSLLSPVFISLLLAVAARTAAQDNQEHRRLIDQLKKTLVSDIEAGLPQESFDSWFAGLVKPAEIDYEVKDCTDETAATGGSQPVSCVIAYTKPPQLGWNRGIEIRFFVVAPPERTGGRVTLRPLVPRLVQACEGPSDPKMKRPTRCYTKLSDLEKLVRGSATH